MVERAVGLSGAAVLTLSLAGCAAWAGVRPAEETSTRTAAQLSPDEGAPGTEGDCYFMRRAFVEPSGDDGDRTRHCVGAARPVPPAQEPEPERIKLHRERLRGWEEAAEILDWRVSRPSWLPPDRRRVGLHTEEMRAEPSADPEPIGVSALYGPAEGQPRPGELIGLKQWVDHGHGQDNIAADAAAARDAGLRVEEHEIAGASAYLIHGGVTIDGDAHDDIALRWSDGEVIYRLHAPSSEHREDLLRIARSLEPVR